MLVGGVAVYSSADAGYYTYSSSNYGTQESGDPKAAVGILMMVSGAGMTVPGIILWSKGSKKYNHYLETRREELPVSLHIRGKGLSLQYRF